MIFVAVSCSRGMHWDHSSLNARACHAVAHVADGHCSCDYMLTCSPRHICISAIEVEQNSRSVALDIPVIGPVFNRCAHLLYYTPHLLSHWFLTPKLQAVSPLETTLGRGDGHRAKTLRTTMVGRYHGCGRRVHVVAKMWRSTRPPDGWLQSRRLFSFLVLRALRPSIFGGVEAFSSDFELRNHIPAPI